MLYATSFDAECWIPPIPSTMARPNPMDSFGSDASWIYIVGTDVDGIPGASSAQGAGTTDIEDNPGALSAQSASAEIVPSAPSAGRGDSHVDGHGRVHTLSYEEWRASRDRGERRGTGGRFGSLRARRV